MKFVIRLSIILLFIQIVSCKSEIEQCNAFRIDLTRDFECTRGIDTFYFHVWLDPVTVDSDYPQIVKDSINKVVNSGFVMRKLNELVIEKVSCIECEKIYKLHSGNVCMPI